MGRYDKYDTKKGVRWYYQTYIKDPRTGKSKRVMKRGFTSRGAAKLACEALEETAKRGKDVFKKVTFKEIAEEFLKKQEKVCKPPTMYSKRSKFKSQIYPAFGEWFIDEITSEDCQEWIDKLEEKISSARDYGIQANLVFKYARRKN